MNEGDWSVFGVVEGFQQSKFNYILVKCSYLIQSDESTIAIIATKDTKRLSRVI